MNREKPELLFVMNNMCMGGIQKALVSLLDELAPHFKITVLLFWKSGSLIDEIPSSVDVIETKSLFRYIGMAQKDCSTTLSRLIRGGLVVVTRILGRAAAIKLMKRSIKKDRLKHYDAAISYSHCQNPKMFYAGTAEYVLALSSIKNKICYIHCDYEHSGTACATNNDIYRGFNTIVCVSESVKNGLLKIIPDMEKKVVSIVNPINEGRIKTLAHEKSVEYNSNVINLLSVARICREKGIERILKILADLHFDNFRYYIIGDGAQKIEYQNLSKYLGIADKVIFVGETNNPYRYMINADVLLVPSYHEAAPVVFQEATLLGLPVFTTKTLSAVEMIGEKYGWVVENNDVNIKNGLIQLLNDKSEILRKKKAIRVLKPKKVDIVKRYEELLNREELY